MKIELDLEPDLISLLDLWSKGGVYAKKTREEHISRLIREELTRQAPHIAAEAARRNLGTDPARLNPENEDQVISGGLSIPAEMSEFFDTVAREQGKTREELIVESLKVGLFQLARVKVAELALRVADLTSPQPKKAAHLRLVKPSE